MEKNIFKEAFMGKYRFSSSKGEVSVEELFNFGVTELDSIYVGLNHVLEDEPKVSLLKVKTKARLEKEKRLNIKMDIVKEIVCMKVEAQDKAILDKEKAEKKRKILDAIADIREEKFKGKKEEELIEMLNELGAEVE